MGFRYFVIVGGCVGLVWVCARFWLVGLWWVLLVSVGCVRLFCSLVTISLRFVV